jgi:hypothetical protein
MNNIFGKTFAIEISKPKLQRIDFD